MKKHNLTKEYLDSLSDEELAKEMEEWDAEEQAAFLCLDGVMTIEEFRKLGLKMINDEYDEMEEHLKTRERFVNDALYKFRGGMAREFYYANEDYPYIPYYYDPIDDCLHADAVRVPFHYKNGEITYKVIGESLDELDDALREYFEKEKEKGIILF